MNRSIKIFEDDRLIFERNLSVNTVILKGRLFKEPQKLGEAVHFVIKISNGKDDASNEWRKPTFADCTAFGSLGEEILENYHENSEIFFFGKFYSNKKDEKIYKGFKVRELIDIKKSSSDAESFDFTSDNYLPF